VQHDLEESEERADQAENAMAKLRAKGRTSSSLTRTVVGGGAGGAAAVSSSTTTVSRHLGAHVVVRKCRFYHSLEINK